MSFSRPLWLLLLPPLVAVVVATWRWGLSSVPPRQRRLALVARVTLVTLLVVALAGLRLGAGGDRVAVVFLVDRSDSMGPRGVERSTELVREAVRAKRRGDLTAVVAFGAEPRLEFGMTANPDVQPLAATPDASATDIAGALRLAEALFPEGTKRRIVVLTDGRETSGAARREAARLARAGIAIEGFTVGEAPGGDARIESVDAPAHLRRGEAYRVSVTVAGAGGPVHLELSRDGKVVYSKDRILPPGRRSIAVDEVASAPGVRRYEARLRAASDAVPENNRGSAAVVIEGRPRVLIVEGERGEALALERALRAGRLEVRTVSPAEIPLLGDLLRYDATVLVDVAAPALAPEHVRALRVAVGDAGRGLVTIGGEDSYGLGGYRDTELEQMLPVESDIRDPKRRPSVAQAIVVDTSGSMGRCHCRNQMGPRNENGIDKTDISRAGAARAVRALADDDIVGVLAFNTTARWVVPMQKLPSEDVVRNGLASMRAAGGTNIPQALHAALAELRQQKAKLKHVILFTDGWTEQQELVDAARRISRQGITLSVVATGEGTGDVLSRMAEAGRGRFYAGTNLTDVPQIMMQEALLASRNFVNEGVFRPVIAAQTAVTESLRSSPALLGYVATSAKGLATVELELGAKDPLLATWRLGLGTVTSWTSDAKARWARLWVSWQGFRDFWTRTVRATFAPPGSGALMAEARTGDGRLLVEVGGEQPLPAGATATARIVDPRLQIGELRLERTGPSRFVGETPAGSEGTYLALVTVRDAAGRLLFRGETTASASYSAEYLVTQPDPTLVRDLAHATGARPSIRPAQAFDRAGLKADRTRRDLWVPLAVVAALLLPVDVALRRLLVTRKDLRRALDLMRDRRRRRPVPVPAEREERIDRLFEAKRRASERDDAQPAEPDDEPPERR